MTLHVEGPTGENLIQEVRQVVIQSVATIAVIQVELGDIHNKFMKPAELLEGES